MHLSICIKGLTVKLKSIKFFVFALLLGATAFVVMLQIDNARNIGYSDGYDYGAKVVEKRLNDLVELQAEKLRCYENQSTFSADECIAVVLKKRVAESNLKN